MFLFFFICDPLFPHDSLIQLFEPDPHKRLGGGPDGLQEIKRHPFFASLDWDALAHLEITPSFIPDV